MSRDFKQIEREIAQTARCAVKWRFRMSPRGRRRNARTQKHMLFIAEAYRLLAERAKERSERLARHASHMKKQ